MSRRLFLRLAWLISLAQGLSAATPAPGDPEKELNRLQIEADLRFLASDELAGRKTGTAGADTAARYIAEGFRAAGVLPFPQLKGYLQKIPFRHLNPPRTLHLQLGSREVGSAQLVWLGGPAAEIRGEARYSETWSPELKGKIWLAPLSLAAGTAGLEEQLQARWEEAFRKGALAIVHLTGDDSLWGRLADYLNRARVEIAPPPGSDTIPHLLAAVAPDRGMPAVAAVLRSGQLRTEDFTSANVVGMIEGSDPDVRDEFVALMAHYDHLGIVEESGEGADQDRIFNGARDNGMGVAALLGAARALGLHPPRRSVLLLAVTGEEEGLLGSRYFVDNPLLPLQKTTFALNVDGAGFTDTGVVTVIGLERTGGRSAIAQGTADFGLEAIPEPPEGASLFTRSDNYSFASKGVPSVTYSPGFRRINQDLMRHYHQPSDEAGDQFDFVYLVKFVRAFARAARYLADSEVPLSWTPGDPFESAGRALHGLP